MKCCVNELICHGETEGMRKDKVGIDGTLLNVHLVSRTVNGRKKETHPRNSAQHKDHT